jgi:hypothetical protein
MTTTIFHSHACTNKCSCWLLFVLVCVCEDTFAQHNSIHLPKKIHSCPFALVCTISLLCECCLLIIFVCKSAVHTLYEITCDSSMGKQLLNKRKKSIHTVSQWSNEDTCIMRLQQIFCYQACNIQIYTIWVHGP